MKARGEGLAFPLDQFDVSVTGEPMLLDVRGGPGEAEVWDLRDVDPASGYVGTVAAEGRGWQLDRLDWPSQGAQCRYPQTRSGPNPTASRLSSRWEAR